LAWFWIQPGSVAEEDMIARFPRFAVLALCCLWLALFSACATSTTIQVPTAPPTVPPTRPPAATPTVPQYVAFQQELGAITGLRGQFIGGPGGTIDPLADVTIVHVLVSLASPSLADAQWDAFAIQQALWTGQEFTIPAGWEVSVEFFVPSADPNASSLGLQVGVANLHTESARQFGWDHLSPEQAWAQYDGTEYNPAGL
jgi:hypothetical protein